MDEVSDDWAKIIKIPIFSKGGKKEDSGGSSQSDIHLCKKSRVHHLKSDLYPASNYKQSAGIC